MKLENIPNFAFEIVENDGEKSMKLISTRYFKHFLKTKSKVGDKGSMTLTFKKPTRSQQQLRYYAVLVGLLADHAGYTWEECHDALMRLKWGTREIKIGDSVVSVRKSVADKALFPKGDMMEQIEYTQEKCFELDIHVPSMEELGYISNYGPR